MYVLELLRPCRHSTDINMKDYFMILTSVPTLSNHQRASIQHNISQILQLHQDLLADLHRVVPNAEYTQSAQQDPYPVTRAKHIRFHSADLTTRFTEHKITRKLRHSLDIGRSPDHRPRALATDTKTAGEIAKIFNKHVSLENCHLRLCPNNSIR
jgi:hypothetical protein